MTDRPPRRGRRDNGLEASAYAVAADVDPRVGEHLLDVLALADIAAYLQPTSDLDPVTRMSVLPARPTDRLYVDRAHLDEAREYARRLDAGHDPLDEANHGGDPDDFETRWQELVSQLETGDGGDRDGRVRPEAGDTEVEQDDRPPRLPRIRSALPDPRAEEPTLLDALDTDVYDDDDQESFVPPEPPPLPRISGPAAISLGIIAFGLLVLVWPKLLTYFNIRSTEAAMVVATGCLVLGSIGLVSRLRSAPDEDAPPDDGARV